LGRSVPANVGVERVDRQLVLIALAQQHPERTLTVTPLPRRVGEPSAQELERSGQVAAVAVVADRLGRGGQRELGERVVDPAGDQAAANSGSPACSVGDLSLLAG
jgi:hypothetical protein